MKIEELLQDSDYSWREDITDSMNTEDIYVFLVNELKEVEEQNEWYLAYSITREMIYRYPEDIYSWERFEIAAERSGNAEEATLAKERLEILKQS